VLAPNALLEATQQIERDLGRTEKSHNGIYHDRLIDIDILLAFENGQSIAMQTPQLTLPHPLMHQRDFVLIPLRQIAPTLAI
jgi:2-amino-4-hydroxy-6-hydroxymethyldihydropteridine diphosphokinase